MIEDPAERVETLIKAWDYAEKVIVISAMTSGADSYANAREYGDGYITSTKTFQKYYEQKNFSRSLKVPSAETLLQLLQAYSLFSEMMLTSNIYQGAPEGH